MEQILAVVLELAVIIGVIAILDWLWSFIEPYMKLAIDKIAKHSDKLNRAKRFIQYSLIQ